MAHSNDNAMNNFWQVYGYRSAARIKNQGEEDQLFGDRVLHTPTGKENFVFSVGQKVFTTGTGGLKGGIEVEVKDRMKDNGYCKYLVGGSWERQQDLMIEKESE